MVALVMFVNTVFEIHLVVTWSSVEISVGLIFLNWLGAISHYVLFAVLACVRDFKGIIVLPQNCHIYFPLNLFSVLAWG